MKQSYIVNSIMEIEYIVAFEAIKEVVQLKKFFMGLEVIPSVIQLMTLFYDNNGARAQSKEPRHH